jgi:hypothetical protein
MEILIGCEPWMLECVILWGVPSSTGRTCAVCAGSPVLQPDPNQRWRSYGPEYCVQCWCKFWADREPNCHAWYRDGVSFVASFMLQCLAIEYGKAPEDHWPQLTRMYAQHMEDAFCQGRNPPRNSASRTNLIHARPVDTPRRTVVLRPATAIARRTMLEMKWQELRGLLKLRDAAMSDSCFPLPSCCPEHADAPKHAGSLSCRRCDVYWILKNNLEGRHLSREQTLQLRQELEAAVIVLETYDQINSHSYVLVLWQMACTVGPLCLSTELIDSLLGSWPKRPWRLPPDLRSFAIVAQDAEPGVASSTRRSYGGCS